jgi:hypothetical protein
MTVSHDRKEREWWNREQFLEHAREQDSVIYAGLIVLGVYLVQPFITATSLDMTSTICVVAFSLSLPLMAFLLMVNRLGSLYRDASHPWYISVAKSVGILSACVGVVAAFWHMTWIARVVVMVGGILGVAVQSAFYSRLARALGFSSAEYEKPPDNASASPPGSA